MEKFLPKLEVYEDAWRERHAAAWSFLCQRGRMADATQEVLAAWDNKGGMLKSANEPLELLVCSTALLSQCLDQC